MAIGTTTKQINIIVNAIDRTGLVLDRMNRNFKFLSGSILGMAAGFASFQSVKSAIDNVAQFSEYTRKLSTATGMSTESTSRMLYTMQQVGINTDRIMTPLEQFEKRLEGIELVTDGVSGVQKQALEVLQQLGIKSTDAAGKLLPLDTILAQLADKFKSMPDGIEKMGLIMDLFSRGGSSNAGAQMELFFNLGSEGIKQLNEEADRLGVTLDSKTVASMYRFAQSENQVSSAVLGIQKVIAVSLAPYLTQLAAWFVGHSDDIRGFFTRAIPAVISFAVQAVANIRNIINTLDNLVGRRAAVIIAVAAIGAAMILAWGPGSPALAGLFLIIANLDKISKFKIDIQGTGAKAVAPGSGGIGGAVGDANAFLGKVLKSIPGVGGFLAPGIDYSTKAAQEAAAKKDAMDQIHITPPGINDPGAYNYGVMNDFNPDVDGNVFDPSAAKDAEDAAKKLAQAMKDGIIDMQEALDNNLTPAMAGDMEAQYALSEGTQATRERTFELAKEIERLAYAAQYGGRAVALMAKDILTSTLDAQKQAAQDIFSNPTREQATLQLQLAVVNEQLAQMAQAEKTYEASINTAIENLNKMKDALDDNIDRLKQQSDGIDKQMSAARDGLDVFTRALDDSIQALEDQKTSLQRQLRDLAPGQERTRRELQAQLDAADDAIKGTRDQEKDRRNEVEDQINALQRQKDAINDQIDGINKQKDALDNQVKQLQDALTNGPIKAFQDLKDSIQTQLDIMSTHQEVLKAQLVVSDQMLLDTASQNALTQELMGNITLLSGQLLTVDSFLGEHFLTSVQTARDRLADWTQALIDSKTAISSSGTENINSQTVNVYGPVNIQSTGTGSGSATDQLVKSA